MKQLLFLVFMVSLVLPVFGSLPHFHNQQPAQRQGQPAVSPDEQREARCPICLENYGQTPIRVPLDCSVATGAHDICLDCLLPHIQAEQGRIKIEEDQLAIRRHKPSGRKVGCPVCRNPLSYKKALSWQDDQLNLGGIALSEDDMRKVQAANYELAKDPRNPYHIPAPAEIDIIPHRPAPAEVDIIPLRPRTGKSFFSSLTAYTGEAMVGLFWGMLISGEFKKTNEKEQTNRALTRTLYIPALLCGNALLHKFKPARGWDKASVGSLALGMLAGILIPNLKNAKK